MNDELLNSLRVVIDQLEHDAGLIRLPTPRDYVPCRFCCGGPAEGPGCMACFNARQRKLKELAEQWAASTQERLQPIFTARFDAPEEMAQLRAIFSADKLTEAFGPGGGGLEKILQLAKEAMAQRHSTGDANVNLSEEPQCPAEAPQAPRTTPGQES